MDRVLLEAFSDELRKIASPWGHAAEVVGLGTLAAPHVYNAVTGKKASHKTERNTELAGLGILAAPSVKALMSKAKIAHVKRAAVDKLIQKGVQTLGTGRAAVKSGMRVGSALTAPAKPLTDAKTLMDKIRQAKAAYGTPAAKPVLIKP
jgi:hypothetical protein